jgi:hypothetical protein
MDVFSAHSKPPVLIFDRLMADLTDSLDHAPQYSGEFRDFRELVFRSAAAA